jgi:hypothetical protein
VSLASTTVDYFRTEWASRFVDTCSSTRVTGSSFNETTGQTEPTTEDILTDAPCLVRPATAREIDLGEARLQEVDYDLYLPYDTALLEAGDLVTVTSVLDASVPVLRVLRGFADSYLTRRHYECEARP